MSARVPGPPACLVQPVRVMLSLAQLTKLPFPVARYRSVTKKADVRHFTNARGEGKLFSVELIDESSAEIRATFFGSAGEQGDWPCRLPALEQLLTSLCVPLSPMPHFARGRPPAQQVRSSLCACDS